LAIPEAIERFDLRHLRHLRFTTYLAHRLRGRHHGGDPRRTSLIDF
jgi:hypothetical protein